MVSLEFHESSQALVFSGAAKCRPGKRDFRIPAWLFSQRRPAIGDTRADSLGVAAMIGRHRFLDQRLRPIIVGGGQVQVEQSKFGALAQTTLPIYGAREVRFVNRSIQPVSTGSLSLLPLGWPRCGNVSHAEQIAWDADWLSIRGGSGGLGLAFPCCRECPISPRG